jgi:hypothetical protein
MAQRGTAGVGCDSLHDATVRSEDILASSVSVVNRWTYRTYGIKVAIQSRASLASEVR